MLDYHIMVHVGRGEWDARQTCAFDFVWDRFASSCRGITAYCKLAPFINNDH